VAAKKHSSSPPTKKKADDLRLFAEQARRNVYYRKRPPAALRRPVSRRSAFQALSRSGFARTRKPAQPSRIWSQLHRIMQPAEVAEFSPALTNAERWASQPQAIKPRVRAECVKGTFRISEMSIWKKYFRAARWIFTAARLHRRSTRR